MKLNPKELADLRRAQHKCYDRWSIDGMARIMENGVKQIGTLIRPEIHQQITPNYTVATGFKVVSEGSIWAEVFKQAGMEF